MAGGRKSLVERKAGEIYWREEDRQKGAAGERVQERRLREGRENAEERPGDREESMKRAAGRRKGEGIWAKWEREG